MLPVTSGNVRDCLGAEVLRPAGLWMALVDGGSPSTCDAAVVQQSFRRRTPRTPTHDPGPSTVALVDGAGRGYRSRCVRERHPADSKSRRPPSGPACGPGDRPASRRPRDPTWRPATRRARGGRFLATRMPLRRTPSIRSARHRASSSRPVTWSARTCTAASRAGRTRCLPGPPRLRRVHARLNPRRQGPIQTWIGPLSRGDLKQQEEACVSPHLAGMRSRLERALPNRRPSEPGRVDG